MTIAIGVYTHSQNQDLFVELIPDRTNIKQSNAITYNLMEHDTIQCNQTQT